MRGNIALIGAVHCIFKYELDEIPAHIYIYNLKVVWYNTHEMHLIQ